MSKKAREQKKRARAWFRYYRDIIAAERKKIEGYRELAQVHNAYITILLNKLGATEDNMITITASEVTEALTKYETRVVPAENGFGLYCEVIAEE